MKREKIKFMKDAIRLLLEEASDDCIRRVYYIMTRDQKNREEAEEDE